MVVEIRDWCQNVGEYNTYNFCIWHFGLCVIVSKIERCRSSDPPYEIAINPWWRGGRGLPSLIALWCCVHHDHHNAMCNVQLKTRANDVGTKIQVIKLQILKLNAAIF